MATYNGRRLLKQFEDGIFYEGIVTYLGDEEPLPYVFSIYYPSGFILELYIYDKLYLSASELQHGRTACR